MTDEAYDRLKSWKDEEKNSFSKVVLEKVPKRRTFGDLAAGFDKLPPLTAEQAKIMEDVVAEANDCKNYPDPWTTS